MESEDDPLHVPPLPPDTEPHETCTAETGTVGQPENELELACTLRVQFFKCEPAEIVHDTVALEEPNTEPELGLFALKLTVPGEAESSWTVPRTARTRESRKAPARGSRARAMTLLQATTSDMIKTLPRILG